MKNILELLKNQNEPQKTKIKRIKANIERTIDISIIDNSVWIMGISYLKNIISGS